jgi:RecB family exonuclease
MTQQPNHAARLHANLGASSSSRWMACPGSIRMSDGIPSRSGPAARRGTAAHQLAEQCLEENAPAYTYLDRIVTVEDEPIRLPLDLCDAVQLYIDTLRADHQDGDDFRVEQKFALTAIHPQAYGTADAVRYRRATGHLTVYDFKAGSAHAVEVGNNSQLLYYALGAALVDIHRPLDCVTLRIIQPLARHSQGPVRSHDLTGQDLMRFGFRLREAAHATDRDDAPLITGDHCRWCPAAEICPAKKSAACQEAADLFDANSA